jgi:hypothetical protein
MAVGLWERFRVVIAGDISFPIRGRRIPGTAASLFVSEPERRHGKRKGCIMIQIIRPTRSNVRGTGARFIPITGRNTVRSISIRRSAIVTSRECETENTMGAIDEPVLSRIGE